MVFAKPMASCFVISIVFLTSLSLQAQSENQTVRKQSKRRPASERSLSPALPSKNKAAPVSSPGAVPASTSATPSTPAGDSIHSWALGIISWPETLSITDSAGNSFDATAQFYVPSIHWVRRRNRTSDGFSYEAYAFYGKADLQADPGGLIYFQKRVSVYGLGAVAGWFFRPASRQVNIGISMPLQIRQAGWTDPPGGGSVNRKLHYAIGAVLDARWRLTPDLAINQRIGGFLGHKSALWMINLEWTL